MLRGVAAEAMQRQYASLNASESLERALEELERRGVGLGFVVGDDRRWISPDEPLDVALEAMVRHNLHGLPVVENDVLVGILSRVQTERFLSLPDRVGFPLSEVVDEISPEDIMFGGNLSVYLRTGASGLECARRALTVAGRSRTPRRILDFGCGHGRVLRFLKAAFPTARLTACDIDVSGIEFCAKALGADPVASTTDLSKVNVEGSFDLIWSGSLFTHVNEETWGQALLLFASLLDESGVLAFSTAGAWAADKLRKGAVDYGLDSAGVASVLEQYGRSGFGYVDYPGQRGYGITLSTPEWVSVTVESRPGLRVISHDERAFDAHQDLVVAVPA